MSPFSMEGMWQCVDALCIFPRPVAGDAGGTCLLIGRRHKPFYSDYSEKDNFGDFSIKSLRTSLAIHIFQKKIITMCGFVSRTISIRTELSCRLPRLFGPDRESCGGNHYTVVRTGLQWLSAGRLDNI